MCAQSLEIISDGLTVCTSELHRFGTDAVLLTAFSGYRCRDRVCDLGTGCGIIPMLMQRENPPREIYGVDIQPEAIAQFRRGISESRLVQSQLYPICADLRQLWEGAPLRQLDLVTCNPPYKAYQAGLESKLTAQKIARHEVLCNIYDVCAAAKKLLKFGGRLCVCNRPERLADVIAAMRDNGIEPKRLQFVAKSSEASPWLFLIEGRSGGKPFLNVLPMQIISDGSTVTTRQRTAFEGEENEKSNL